MFTTQKTNACTPWTARSVFDWKDLLQGKFGPKNQNCLFKVKFDTKINLNMVVSILSVLD